MRKIFVLTFFVLFLIFSYPCLAQPWWNSSWHFRFPVNISSSIAVENASTKVNVNFSSLLEEVNISGAFDPNSIRVIEESFEQSHDWENETIDKGNITWIANGTTPANTNRTFWIYFDIIENGEKPEGKIISEKPYWRSGYEDNMDVYSPEWNRSWAKMIEVYWKWSTEAAYDFAYLYVDGSQVRKEDGIGSEEASFLGSGIQGRFTSDSSTTNPTTDEYGTYGCAVDWIKFYPVTNYTAPLLNISQGGVELQALKNWLELPEDGSLIDRGSLVLIRGNVTDENLNLITSASVNFTLITDGNEYSCEVVDEGNGWYNCTWDSTGKPLGNYSIRMNSSKEYYEPNSTLWIDRFTLRPGPPIVTLSLSEQTIEQSDWIQINASVEDQSGTGISWVKANITQPNGYLEQANMTNIETDVWTLNYTNTSQRGIYSVSVYASDNTGRVGFSTTTFKVYLKLNVSLKTKNDYYYQGESGRIEYSLQDGEGNFLQNATVILKIRDPDNNLIWNSTRITNINGSIQPLPTFSLTSDDPVGTYTLFSNTSYYDHVANISVSRKDTYNFIVYEKAAIEMLVLKSLEGPGEVSVGDDLKVIATVTDSVENVDVDSAKASLYDPVNNTIVEDVNMTHISTGVYGATYKTSSSSTQGNWEWVVTIVKAGKKQTGHKFERLIGGPFDVRNITVVDNTIPDLAISVIIENTGAADQDVTVEWNLTRTDTGETLDTGADTILIPATSTKEYIAHPTTNYLGEVKITFLVYYSGTEKAGAYSTFTTGEAVTTTTTTVPSVGLPTVPITERVPKVEIVEYTKELEIERGWIGFLRVKVNDSGNTDLHNLSITIEGIQPDWIELPGEFYLTVNETKTFDIKFAVPINAKSGNYQGKIIVSSLEARDEKSFILRVFASKAELIYYQIQTLKDRLNEITNKTLQAEKAGKDVKVVKDLLDNARDKILVAERYFDSKLYDDASDMVRIAKSYLDKAEYELQVSKPVALPTYVVILSIVQKWLVLILIALVAGMVCIIALVVIKGKRYEIKIPKSAIRKAVIGQVSARRLEKEREKIKKLFSVLEKEYKEGIISKESYEELKKKNEERLSEIEKQLKEI